MREILFRGKRCDNGEWAQGFYVRADHHWHKNGIHKDWIVCGASANGGWFALHNKYAVAHETVGQFTGLTDKNGKKIFEGDIIEWDELEWGSKHREVVTWDYNLFAIRKDDWGEWCEVIGNIHDNPELIGGKGNA